MPAGFTEQDFWEDFYAEQFGWTPEQVAGLPSRFLDRNPLIREAKGKAREMRRIASQNGPRL